MARKPFDELTIADDFMFSKVMRNEKLCREFLQLILGVKIRKLVYIQYEKTISAKYESKGVRLDVYVEDDKDTVYNLEMQTTHHDNIPKRSRYYQDLIDVDMLEKGQGYYELKNSIVIFICPFDLFGKGRHIYRFKNICTEDSSILLDDKTEKIFVNTTGYLSDISEELKNVLEYFNGTKAYGNFAEQLDEEVHRIKFQSEWRREYMVFETKLMDEWQAGRKVGYEQGIEKGRLQEVEKNKKHQIETIIRLHERNMTVDEIAQIMGMDSREVKKYL